LHHLPDYIQTIKELAALLHTGGCMYLDHEASPYYWTNQNFRGIERIINFSNRIVDFPFRFRRGTKISIDYNMSDYWTSKDRHIDHKKIERAFIQLHFSIHRRIDYHVSKTLVVNPAFIAYQLLMKPTTSCWIAKK
jgi:lantibiotic modifying enzyme